MSADFECPQCHERSTQVLDTRDGPIMLGQSIRRRRRCLRCSQRFTTYETVEHPRQTKERIERAKLALEAILRIPTP